MGWSAGGTLEEMKILILSTIQGCAWAGTEEVWYHFAELALSKGHDVMLAADSEIANSPQVFSLKSRGLKVTERKPFRPHRLYLLKNRVIPDHQAALHWQPDVCLINAGSPLDLEFSPHLDLLLQRLNCKKVFFCHFNSDRLVFSERTKTAQLLASMDKLVFVNESNKNELERQLALKFKHSHVILNSSRLGLQEPMPFPDLSKVSFANVARLETYWKGQDILIDILHRKEWIQRDSKLEFFGSGKDQDYLHRLIDLHHLKDKVFLSGYVRSVEEIWLNRHALLLPSRGEGTPLVILEAMMCGRPVVTTDVGGNAEVVEDGVTGWIAEAATPRSFSRTMERAWESRDRWEGMGRAAHHKAKQLSNLNPSAKLLEILQNFFMQTRVFE
jgi:glycosyltransferase involved in cell wall biosynthesis